MIVWGSPYAKVGHRQDLIIKTLFWMILKEGFLFFAPIQKWAAFNLGVFMGTSSFQSYRAVLLASIGSGLEYYCFITYALLSPVLSQLFFIKENPHLAILNTLIIFAMGYLTAPIGAFVFGRFADRYGRKPAFLTSLLLMATATILIGMLPTFAMAGYWGVSLLIILRLMQGFAAGAEIPGGITFIVEHAKDQERSFLCSLMFFSVAIGALLSTFVNYLLSHYLSMQEMLTFGWRIAFWAGGLLGIVGLFVRRHATETPLFLEKSPSAHIHWRHIFHRDFVQRFLIGFGIMLLPASMVTFGLFLPAFYQHYYYAAPEKSYLALTMGLLWSAFGLPVFGYLADKLGHKRWYFYAVIATIMLLAPCFLLLHIQGHWGLFFNSILYHLLVVGMAGVYPCLLAELFPTSMRYTGVGLSYMLSYSIVGFVPFFINFLVLKTGQPWALLAYFIPIGIISLVAASRLEDLTGTALR